MSEGKGEIRRVTQTRINNELSAVGKKSVSIDQALDLHQKVLASHDRDATYDEQLDEHFFHDPNFHRKHEVKFTLKQARARRKAKQNNGG